MGGLQLHPDGRVMLDGRLLRLSPKERAVLRVLADARGAIVSKNRLIDAVWNGRDVADASVVRAVHGLRRAVGTAPDGSDRIETCYGTGYRLAQAVFEVPPERPPTRPAVARPARARATDPSPFGEEGVERRVIEACLEARYLVRRRDPSRLAEAMQLYAVALAWHPGYLPALVGSAKCDLFALGWGLATTPADRARVRETVRQVEAVVEGLTSLAWMPATMASAEWRFAEADALFAACAATAPDPEWLLFYSNHLLATGRAAEATAVMEQAVRLDPLSPNALAYLGIALFFARRYDEALRAAREALALGPDCTAPVLVFAVVAAFCGRQAEALEAIRRALAVEPVPWMARGFGAWVCAACRREAEARELIRASSSDAVVGCPSLVAVAAARLGNLAEIVGWVRIAAQARCTWLPHIRFDPRFATAMTHPAVVQAFPPDLRLPAAPRS
jgi:DNA-binding winged helix-turn-helix (wHTH) protein